jgi:hypothetical protein
MDPINELNQIARILRQKLSERSSPLSSKGAGSSTAVSSSTARTCPKASAEEIKRKIGERIKALSGEDKGGRRAAQIFVEVILLWEFGDHLIQDPQFTELSREVVNTMAENPKIWHKLHALLKEFGYSPK